ncbi:hypothetical protein BaRGS_00039565 [Batillaria attramentaria]|uniref:Secreted protein n=1 Tax=Batillaria attramentaria TaxID=370345 RepID=A0ABD0J2G9_9CAEN
MVKLLVRASSLVVSVPTLPVSMVKLLVSASSLLVSWFILSVRVSFKLFSISCKSCLLGTNWDTAKVHSAGPAAREARGSSSHDDLHSALPKKLVC